MIESYKNKINNTTDNFIIKNNEQIKIFYNVNYIFECIHSATETNEFGGYYGGFLVGQLIKVNITSIIYLYGVELINDDVDVILENIINNYIDKYMKPIITLTNGYN